jgi:hypothetical protein
MSYKYLPLVKIVSLLLMLTAIGVDYQSYSKLFFAISLEKSLTPPQAEYYSQYAFCLYFAVIIYEYLLSIYITLKANHPLRNVAYQFAKHTAKVVGASGAVAVGYSHAPVEPNSISNFIHTKTPFGRGYDYEIGSLNLKVKGDYISGALGREDMLSAVEKHASDSHILDANKLDNIITDPEYNSKIRSNTTISEKVFLGIPLVDLFTNTEKSIPTTQDNFSETTNNSEDESPAFDIKKRPVIRKYKSEPLPQKNKPFKVRRNTR